MVPAVFAAGETLKLTCDKDVFEFTVYKVAALSSHNTGAYTFEAGVDDDVKTAVNKPNQSGADLLAALNTAFKAGKTVGTKLDGVVKKGSDMTISEEGIFFAAVTKEHPNKTKVNNAVIVWPEYKNNNWQYVDNASDTVKTIALGAKVEFGDVSVGKTFTGEDDTVNSQNSGMNKTVSFTLTASTVGSAGIHATKYVIWDKMSKGLSLVSDSVKVYYNSATAANAADDDFTVKTESFTSSHSAYKAANDADYADGTYITITAKASTLSGDTFYTKNKVIVEYQAKINKDANIGTAKGNPNKNGLLYNDDINVDGDEKIVYTCQTKIKKIDGQSNKALKGATLGLYEGTTLLAKGTSASDGFVKFYKDENDTKEYKVAPGTYSIKEISAPKGYVLSKDVVNFTIKDTDIDNGGEFTVAANFKNYPAVAPMTGGEGTMIFTIVGASLILLAGALAVVILKKRNKA